MFACTYLFARVWPCGDRPQEVENARFRQRFRRRGHGTNSRRCFVPPFHDFGLYKRVVTVFPAKLIYRGRRENGSRFVNEGRNNVRGRIRS